jgi:hypothetical protein
MVEGDRGEASAILVDAEDEGDERQEELGLIYEAVMNGVES